jgi:hypothetical protein
MVANGPRSGKTRPVILQRWENLLFPARGRHSGMRHQPRVTGPLPTAGAHRQHPAGRGRGALLRHPGPTSHDSNKTASGEPGAVHAAQRAMCRCILAPAQTYYPADSMRDFVSGASTLATWSICVAPDVSVGVVFRLVVPSALSIPLERRLQRLTALAACRCCSASRRARFRYPVSLRALKRGSGRVAATARMAQAACSTRAPGPLHISLWLRRRRYWQMPL